MEGKERRERIRSKMRDFYDFADSKTEPSLAPTHRGQSIAASDSSTTNIESDQFDVNAYTTSLLKTQSLKGLYDTDRDLRRKVRELDGELQELVYDNYSKFISATDTIRHMRNNITDMDDKLSDLSKNVETIDQVSGVINENLKSHRERIEEMLVVNGMLRKIQFLVKLPDAMKVHIEEERYHAAVKFWTAGDAVLSRHSAIASFQRTHNECRELAKTLYHRLESTLKSTTIASPEEVAVARKIVVDMRALRATSVFGPYSPQENTPEKIDERTRVFEDSVFTMLCDAANSKFENDVKGLMKRLESEFSRREKALSGNISKQRDASNNEMERGGDEEEEGDDDDEEGMSPMMMSVFEDESISNILSAFKTASGQLTVEYERSLDIVGRLDSKALGGIIASAVQPRLLQLVDMFMSRVDGLILMFSEDISMRASKFDLADDDEGVSSSSSSSVTSHYVAVRGRVVSEMSALGKLLRTAVISFSFLGTKFLNSAYSKSDSFMFFLNDTVRGIFDKLHSFCKAFTEERLTCGEDDDKKETTESWCRVLLAVTLISKNVRGALSELTAGNSSSSFSIDATAIRGDFSETSKLLVHTFIAVAGTRYTEMFRSVHDGTFSITAEKDSDMVAAAPTGPSAAMTCALKEVQRWYEVFRAWFPRSDADPSGGMGSATGGGASGSIVSGGGGRSSHTARSRGNNSNLLPSVAQYSRREHHSLLTDVDRMFSNASVVPVLRPKSITAESMTECCITVLLVGLTELIRSSARPIQVSEFQQLQVDLGLLLSVLSRHSSVWFRKEDERRVVNAINEVASSAFDRCPVSQQEGAPLPPASIERLLSQ